MADESSGVADAPARVLIVLLGSIGDVVRALPLLGRLRQNWPRAYIAWAVEPKSEPILRGHPWLDETIIYDRSRAPRSFLTFLRHIRRGRFDLAIDLQRHLKSGIVALASGAPRRLGFARANVKEYNHWFSTEQIPPQPAMRLKLMQYQQFGDLLGLASGPIAFGLRGSPDADERIAELLQQAPRPILGVILGSSWASRLYFPEAIAEVVRSLSVADDRAPAFFPVLIGGPDDRALAAQVEHHLETLPRLNLTGKTRLDELPALFRACAAAFAPDCGPMHIAAAVGCPVVSLWGATAAQRSAPWGFADFAITGAIGCSPCYLRRCPVGRECMRRIDPASVAAAVRRAHMSRIARTEEDANARLSAVGGGR
ncbi:MAG TPA: glycosyltransferase family 9 protein [Candidatus Binataceae bacterium]|nr:glycosyltransferase family 9 protein [Candidatus Binataceae bacterium]